MHYVFVVCLLSVFFNCTALFWAALVANKGI